MSAGWNLDDDGCHHLNGVTPTMIVLIGQIHMRDQRSAIGPAVCGNRLFRPDLVRWIT